jgi:predicted permease
VIQTAVTPSYFAAMGIALRKGRLPAETDTADGRLVAVLNETAARRYWPGEDPIGTRFAIGSLERFGSFRQPRPGEVEWREVVGVVADTRPIGFDSSPQPEVFYGYKQFPLYDTALVVRTAGDPAALARAVRLEAAAVNGRVVVLGVRTMEQVAADAIAEPRMRAAFVALFSGLALALGLLGIYGVMSHTVAQRTQEIGIRMALGADPRRVTAMIVAHSLRLTLGGLLLGLAGAAAAGRAVASLLFGVAPVDPPTVTATCLIMLVTALAASLAPARRALRVDPAIALRSE